MVCPPRYNATFGLPGFPVDLELEKLEDTGQGHEQYVNVGIKGRRSVGSKHKTLIVNKCHINNWYARAIIGGTTIITITMGIPKLATPQGASSPSGDLTTVRR